MACMACHVTATSFLCAPLQMELGSTVLVTVEYKTPYYILCSCSTIAGVYPAFGIFDAVSDVYLPPSPLHLHFASTSPPSLCLHLSTFTPPPPPPLHLHSTSTSPPSFCLHLSTSTSPPSLHLSTFTPPLHLHSTSTSPPSLRRLHLHSASTSPPSLLCLSISTVLTGSARLYSRLCGQAQTRRAAFGSGPQVGSVCAVCVCVCVSVCVCVYVYVCVCRVCMCMCVCCVCMCECLEHVKVR